MRQRLYMVLALLLAGATPAAAQGFAVEAAAIPTLSSGCVFQVQSLSPTVIVCGSAGSGTVSSTGTLTADTLAAWSSSGVLKNSIITQSGSVASAATFNATTAFTISGASINTVGTLGNVCYNSQACTLTGTNFTGVPVSTGISGLGTGVATFLATPSSANLATAVTNETGSGALVFATSPTLVTPNIGAATGASLSLTGSMSVAATQKVFLDGGGDTYITEAVANTMSFYAGGIHYLQMAGNYVYLPTRNLILDATYKIYLDTDGSYDTYISESAADVLDAFVGGTKMLSLTTTATFGGNTSISTAALGNTAAGRSMQVGRNSTRGGASGTIELIGLGGASNFLWADGSAAPGVLRIKATAPVEDNGTTSDRSGTVVGAQTSTLDTKDLIGDAMDPADAFALLVSTPVKRFTYKGDNAYGGTVFQGIIADWSPAFAMDPDAAHPNGRSFNAVSAFGVTVQAMKAIEARLAALDAEVTALRRQVIK